MIARGADPVGGGAGADRQLSLAGHQLIGRSEAGIETCLQWPALDLLFDIGRAPPGSERLRNLFLSHGHIDHAAGLPYYVSLRRMFGRRRPRVYCPAASVAAIRGMLQAWTPLQASAEACELIGVQPGDQLPLKNGHRVEVFEATHRSPAVGYRVIRRHRRLRPELVGLPGAEIARRARAGEVVNHHEDRAELAYTGDTSVELLDREPSLGQVRALIIECTFVGDKVSPRRATELGHIHLDQLAERASVLQNEVVLLSHFSRRYAPGEVRAAVQSRLPPELLARVQLLLPPASHRASPDPEIDE